MVHAYRYRRNGTEGADGRDLESATTADHVERSLDGIRAAVARAG
jgi:hypothetical protein